MLNEIERERRMAEHLFYVSLKYTRAADVIMNLTQRWEKMIDLCIELLLRKAKKNKKIKEVPIAPKIRESTVRKFYKDELVAQVMDLYALFRRIPILEHFKEQEFRKNVTLRVIDGKEISINMDKLKEWNAVLENFIKYIRHQAGK